MIKRRLKEQAGFTLIEMLIVVILLGILAMLIIPQISVSTADANLNTLKSNLASMRNAIELYYHQHNQVYPGKNKNDGTAGPTNAESAAAFKDQLILYTDINGACQNFSDATHIYGPYLKSKDLPTNPYNNLNDVTCNVAMAVITDRTADGTTAWLSHPTTGVFFANDGGAGHNDL
jgi:general secretion pathway protein G